MLTLPAGSNIRKFHDDLQANQKYQRWEDSPNAQGYSGIVFNDLGNGLLEVLIIWTDDGINGYPRTFTSQEERTIQRYLDQWSAANPPTG